MSTSKIRSENVAYQYTSELTQKDNHYKSLDSATQNADIKIAQNAITDEEVIKKIEDVNKMLEKEDITIQYERHEATNRMMIRVVNKQSGDVVKEIPSEKILDLAAVICEQAGLFIDERL